MANMSAPERASYEAISRYQKCLRPIVEAAKRRADLGDRQIKRLGYGCPEQLDDVARKLAFREDYRADEPDFVTLSHEQKIARIKEEFAGHGFCELRGCYPAH